MSSENAIPVREDTVSNSVALTVKQTSATGEHFIIGLASGEIHVHHRLRRARKIVSTQRGQLLALAASKDLLLCSDTD